MKDLFYAIQYFFEQIALAPMNSLRALELENWTAANVLNWGFLIIGTVAFVYWMIQLKKFNDANEENRDPKAHSFLG